MSRVKAKLVCARLLGNWYRTVGYDVLCVLLCEVLVLDRLGQYRMESTGIRRTRTVPVPGYGEPNIQGTRIKLFQYPSVFT